jgi:hypothetical protein
VGLGSGDPEGLAPVSANKRRACTAAREDLRSGCGAGLFSPVFNFEIWDSTELLRVIGH